MPSATPRPDSTALTIMVAAASAVAGAALALPALLLGLAGHLGMFVLVPASLLGFLVGFALLVGRGRSWTRVVGGFLAGAALAAAVSASILLVRGHG